MPDTHDLLSNDVELIARRLEQGLDPNTTVDGGTEGVTLLAAHCFLGHPTIVQRLLQHGADPDRGRGTSGETPLHHALAGGGGDQYQLQIINALLAARANPNKACETGVVTANFMIAVKVRGERPLHRAAAYSSIAVIRTLLVAGAEPDVRDANGDSPLTWGSLHRRDTDILRLLCFGDYQM